MPTYEEEHNLSNGRQETPTEGARAVPTLQQALNDFMTTSTVPTTPIGNRTLVERMLGQIVQSGDGNIESLLGDMVSGIDSYAANGESKGVDQGFLDGLERVNVKKLKSDAACAICTNEYHQDPHPLIVELPCNGKHIFDLDCIAPWLKMNKTCPMCRKDVTKKEQVILVDSEEEEDDWEMYG